MADEPIGNTNKSKKVDYVCESKVSNVHNSFDARKKANSVEAIKDLVQRIEALLNEGYQTDKLQLIFDQEMHDLRKTAVDMFNNLNTRKGDKKKSVK